MCVQRPHRRTIETVGPRVRNGEWHSGTLSPDDDAAWRALVTTCNLLPQPVDASGIPSYRRLTPDDAAAVLGHELDRDAHSPTAWLRKLETPPTGIVDR